LGGICCFENDSAVLDPALLSIDLNILWEDDESPRCFVYAARILLDVLHLCWTEELGDIKASLSEQIQSASNRISEPPSILPAERDKTSRTAIVFRGAQVNKACVPHYFVKMSNDRIAKPASHYIDTRYTYYLTVQKLCCLETQCGQFSQYSVIYLVTLKFGCYISAVNP